MFWVVIRPVDVSWHVRDSAWAWDIILNEVVSMRLRRLLSPIASVVYLTHSSPNLWGLGAWKPEIRVVLMCVVGYMSFSVSYGPLALSLYFPFQTINLRPQREGLLLLQTQFLSKGFDLFFLFINLVSILAE